MSLRLATPILCISLAAISLLGCQHKEAPLPTVAAATASTTAPTTAAAPGAATSAKPFDIQSVPVTAAAMPPFPYLELPSEATGYHTETKDFDRAYVIAGEQLQAVEGRTSERWFPPGVAKMSTLQVFRNYDQAIKAMGGLKIDAVHPLAPAFIQRNGGDSEAILKKLAIPNILRTLPNDVPTFSQYLVRTPKGNVWIAFFIFDEENNVSIKVVEEKPMQQTVALVKADAMASAIAKDGHIALYLNFDNDSDVIRDDSKPVLEEIAKLLAADQALRLRVEGHTDNVGEATHNKKLSRARAESVVKAITAQHITADRLKPEGAGADHPLADNRNEEGRAKNRRVELVRL